MHIEELFVLRLLHIFSGVFWAGAVIYMASFVIPASADAGPAGGQFMQKLMARKVPVWMMVASIVNVLAGFRLMWILSGFRGSWFTSPDGMSLTIGGAAAIIAIIYGMSVLRPASFRMAKLAQAIGNNPPTPEQAAEAGALRKKLATGNKNVAILLSIAVICMSIAKYLPALLA
jgi:uncharacterized membrane protein